MTTPTTVTASPSRLLNHNLLLLRMQRYGQKSCPSKEDRLHDTHRKGSLQHSAGLIQVRRERVIRAHAVLAKRAQCHPHRAAVPVAAVGGGDEAQLVDGCDEGAEEAKVHEGDEGGGALGRREAD